MVVEGVANEDMIVDFWKVDFMNDLLLRNIKARKTFHVNGFFGPTRVGGTGLHLAEGLGGRYSFSNMSRRRREITIYRIAEEAKVSPSTVSRVLNQRTGVSSATRERIAELLQKYNFSPDYPQTRAPKLGVLCPWDDLTDYFRKAMKGVFRFAAEREVEVSIITQAGRSRHSLLEQIRDQQCRAVIVLLAEHLNGEHLEIGKSEIPVIFLDCQVGLEGTGFIDNDSYSGSCAATQHLLDFGHRKIGYLMYLTRTFDHEQRLQGFTDTLKKAGIEADARHIVMASEDDWFPSSGVIGIRLMKRLLAQSPDITAVMTVDDELALGALTAIHETGRAIPKDFSVVGFDNYPETEAWFPALTTVDHPIEEEAYLAAEALHQAIVSDRERRLPRRILPTQLVVRDSTGPAPHLS